MNSHKIRGLSNHPNSCFLNSALQLFLNTNLGRLLSDNKQPNETLEMLRNILMSYHDGGDGPLKIHAFKEHLQKLHPGSYQHDKSYDLTELLERLIDTIGGPFKSSLTGICKINQTCTSCYGFTATMNAFTFVRVGHDWLFEQDGKWVDQVLLDKSKQYIECPKCAEPTRSHQVLYCDLPAFLMFQAERTLLSKDKCHDYLIFREQFDINDDKYRLVAVVYHHGVETTGHYTCKIKTLAGQIIHIDDQKTQIQSSFEQRSRKAVVLLYEKI